MPNNSASGADRGLRGWLIAALAVGSLTAFCVLGTLAVGYASPATREANLDELPSISRITESKAAIECVYVRIVSPHSERVCVVGIVSDEHELTRLFPFLADAKAYPGADSMIGRIPETLMEAVGDRRPFVPTERFWLISVPDRSGRRTTDVHVAFSNSSKRFYLEYSWDR